jgi:hypothetical protein
MNKIRLLSALPVWCVLIAGAMLVPIARGADARLVADTYVDSAMVAVNFGGATALNVAPGRPGLVQFDLSGIASGTNVSVAYLRVFVNKVTLPGTLSFAAATSAWSENSVTFGTQPTAGPAFASTPANTPNAFLVVDVTSVVNGWIAAPGTNFGIEISGDVSGATISLDSKENGQTSHPAQLEINVIGPAGAAGAAGPVGPAGLSPAGPAGIAGPAGPTGVVGPAGPQGPKGLTGLQGDAGIAGVLGPRGPVGPAGPAGPQGIKGSTGAAGILGPSGPRGPTGPAGPTGITGPAGPAGIAGPFGPAGPVGPAGDQGPVGSIGPSGATGSVGANGPQGPAGSAGPAGVTGPLGPAGPQGAMGANGPSGNVFNFAAAQIPNNGAIADTDSNIYYLADNSGGPVLLTLPHANVAGRLVVIHVKLYFANNNTGAQVSTSQLTLKSLPGDTLIVAGQAATTLVSFNRMASLSSDGQGRWVVVGSN